MPSRPTRALIGAGVALAVALALWSGRGGREAAPQAAASPPPAGPQFFSQVAESGPAIPDGRAERRRQLAEQVQLTDHSYCSYLAGSQYPMESRPAARNPDQL